MEDIYFLKTQIEAVEVKTKVSGVQNAPDWINRLNIASEMISEFEDI